MPGISCVVPCYNSAAYLVEAVESLALNCSAQPFEIIIVDDASADRSTKDALATLSERPGIRVERLPEHAGVQRARSIGVALASFECILTLDADDRLRRPQADEPSYVDRAVKMLERDSSLGFVHTGSRMFGAVRGLTISAYPISARLVAAKHHVPTTIVYRKEDALSAGLYDEGILKWQDWSFGVALLASRVRRRLPIEIGYVDGDWHEYRVHSEWPRLSSAAIDELKMTKITVEANREFFDEFYSPEVGADLMAYQVVSLKPSRLTELLHVANFDLRRALTIAREREAELISLYDAFGVP